MAVNSYDGSAFIGVDDDAMGDGSDSTQPLDAWMQWRMQANIEYMAAEPRMICFSPVISNADDFASVTGIRPYTQLQEGSVFFWDVQCFAKQTGIDVTIAYQSYLADGGGGGDDIEANCVVMVGGQKLGGTRQTLPETESAGTPYTGVATLGVDFDHPLNADARVTVWLFVKSDMSTGDFESTTIGAGGNGSTGSTGYGYANKVFSTDDTLFVDVTSGNPTANSLECMILDITETRVTGSNTPNQDMLGIIANYQGAGADTGELVMNGGLPPVADDSLAGQLTAVAKMVKSFFLRAAALEPQFDNGCLERERRQFDGHQLVTSDECHFQHSAIHDLHERKRLVAVGPQGVKDEDMSGYYDKGYATHWPFTIGTDTGDNEVLVEESIYLQTDDPVLEIDLTFICVQHNTAPALAIESVPQVEYTYNPDTGYVEKKPEFEDKSGSGLGAAEWDITVSIDQMDDKVAGSATWAADSSNYCSETQTQRLVMHPASYGSDATGMPPVAAGMNAGAYGQKQSGSRNSNFWYKEGTLFAADLDANYLQTRSIQVDVATTTETTNRLPYRLQISADLSDTPVYIQGIATDAEIMLVLVSYSVHEVPNAAIAASTAITPPQAVAGAGSVSYVGLPGEVS